MIPRAWVEQDGPPRAASEYVRTAKLQPYAAADAVKIVKAIDSLAVVSTEIGKAQAVGIRALIAVILSRMAEWLLRAETESYSRRIERAA